MRRFVAWQTAAALGIAAAMLVGLVGFAEYGFPARLEGGLLDFRFRLRRAPAPQVPVVIVAIDDASIEALGRWPWSREVFAQALDRLAAAGAKVVGFDLLFTEPQPSPLSAALPVLDADIATATPRIDTAERERLRDLLASLAAADDPDAALGRAIARDAPVVVPFALDLDPRGAGRVAPPPAPAWLENSELDRVRGAPSDALPRASGLRLPVASVARAGLLGHVTIATDRTAAYRYDYPVLRYADAYYPSLSLQAVRAFLGVSRFDTVVELGRGVSLGPLLVPTDEAMRLVVNYYPPGGFTTVSFADVLRGRVAASLAGKIVLIGATALGLGDVAPTPFAPAMPGVERHATLVANFLAADFVRRDAFAVAADAALILLGSLGVAVAGRRGIASGIVVAGGSLLAVLLLDDIAFARFGVWLNTLFPAAAILLCFAVVVGGGYAATWRRERRIRSAFSRYLHADLVAELCRSLGALRLGGEERELTVLFADVRDFSTVAEGLSPPDLVALMNEYFTAMTDVVLARRGMLDKFIGDGLMAVFGAPLPDPDHALHACEAALGMRAALGSLQRMWLAEGRPCLDMRIGISTGRMVIGNMGTAQRFDYTVMGDEVNVAARLEAANKILGSNVLLSAATAEHLGARVALRGRGAIEVKGRRQRVEVFELLGLRGAADPVVTSDASAVANAPVAAAG